MRKKGVCVYPERQTPVVDLGYLDWQRRGELTVADLGWSRLLKVAHRKADLHT